MRVTLTAEEAPLAAKRKNDEGVAGSSPHPHAQRPPAEIACADELALLRERDTSPRPPGWRLSPKAVRTFILGDPARGIRKKFVGNPSLVDRAMVALATNRGLIFVGEPGTAKSLLSELLCAAICGRSTLTIQGSAGTTDDQIKYSWNYALLLAEGPTPRALVPAPLYTAMKEGLLVRFEEITRCPLEIQDSLLAALSDRVLAIPEMEGPDAMLFAREGFNVIATANTRDLGVNEMSAALKRRFNFETVFPIPDFAVEMELVREETRRLLARSGVPTLPSAEILELLVTTFRELRAGQTVDGQAMDRLSVPMSTAEAVSVAHALGVRSHYVSGDEATPADLVECLVGAALKTDTEDVARLRRYFDQRVSKRTEPHFRAYYEARHRLPG
ncbi:MAG: AAA family ATPase [Myxococcales bacterium]|nr:AAA family ATPase [Myxococcales bacterium]